MRFVSAFLFAAVFAKAGVYLEPNRGQAATDAPFVARTGEGTLAAGSSAIQYQQRDGSSAAIVFKGASRRAPGEALDSVAGVSHYVFGSDPARWLWDVPHYARLKYANVYAGVDLVYHTTAGDVEFDFNLRPGANPKQIRLLVPADARIDGTGALTLGAMRVHAPVAWQMVAGKRTSIPVRFALQHGREVSFQLGAYDHGTPLTIDPIVELATFLGGSNNDVGIRVQSGSDGSIYLAGNTMSADFPASLPAGDLLNRPETLLNPTAYISHLAPDASKLDWSLFIGGTAWQNAVAMRLDPFGNAYLLGETTSPNFPVTPGAWKAFIDPTSTDYFLVKLSAQTGHIEASTFLGVANAPNPYNPLPQMAIDVAGGVYIGGPRDPTGYFTPTPGALNSSLQQSEFVLRFNSSISAAVYATLWPYGSIAGMAVDPNGNIVIGGVAFGCSQCGTQAFPAVNPLPGIDQNPELPAQAYVARLNPTGTAVNFASLLHGDGRDSAITDLKLAADGSIYLFGYSSGTMFPVVNPLTLPPGVSSSPAMSDDVTDAPFLTRLSADAKSILQSTYFSYEQIVDVDGLNTNLRMDLQPNGYPCVAGLNTPVADQTAGGLVGTTFLNSYYGWSLSCEDSTGTKLNQVTDLPSSAYDDIAAAPDGSFLFTGSAMNNFVTTPGVVQANYGGAAAYANYYAQNGIPAGDAFILRVSLKNPTPNIQLISPNYVLLSTGNNGTCTPLLVGSGFAFGANIILNGKPVAETFVDSGHTTLSFPCSAFQAGDNEISMSLPSPGGGTSSQTVTGLNAPPSTISVLPTSVTQGAPATKVVIDATNLLPTSTLYWNGSPRTAAYVLDNSGASTGHFELILQPSDLAQPSIAVIQVSNPGPGGGLSTGVQFTVLPTSGLGVPILNAPPAYTFGASLPLGPTLQLGGSGFNAGTSVFWDGAQIPVSSFTATQITVQPPAADLGHWGVHRVFAANGSFQSVTVPVYIARAISASAAAYDPLRNRLYVLGSMGTYSPTPDFFAFDAATGNLLSSISNILPNGQAIAVSADGEYVYLGSSGPTGQIMRYNASSGKVDLSWQIPPPAGLTTNGINSLVTPPDSPQTVIVSTTAGDVLIFDESQARPNDSTAQGFFSTYLQNDGGYRVFFATSSRIYVVPGYATSLTGDTPCWMWMDYDASGISGGQTSCSGPPPETKEDSGVTYLTDGSRTFVVSIPDYPSPPTSPAPSLSLDLASRKAWQINPSYEDDYQLMEYGMNAQQFGVQTQIIVGYYSGATSAVFAAQNGAALVVLPGAALLVPSSTTTSQPGSRPADWRPHPR